jgi:hypothetical protein
MPYHFAQFGIPRVTLVFCAMLSAIVAFPRVALGFCRTTTCAQAAPPDECVPGEIVSSCQMAGTPLYWPGACVSFSVQQDDSKLLGITAAQLEAVVRTAFDNWQNVACPNGGKPNLSVVTYPQVACAESRYNSSAPNQNVWMFRDDAWPYGDGAAQTFVSFNAKTGEIYDVDVELNSYMQQFTLDANGFGMDLQSIVQHEAGHFLGLAHAADFSATMWPNYAGGVDQRTLEADDAAGICAVYPPVATPPATCIGEPRNGFSTRCLETSNPGTTDAGTTDAGTTDAGTTDAATVDSGTVRGGAGGGCTFTVSASGRNGARRGIALLAALLGLGIVRSMRRVRKRECEHSVKSWGR